MTLLTNTFQYTHKWTRNSVANQMPPSLSANRREQLLRESASGNNPFLLLSLSRVQAKVPSPQFLLPHGRDTPTPSLYWWREQQGLGGRAQSLFIAPENIPSVLPRCSDE